MSARSCLLCGRSLSRWNGNGDEFCSREHRNQYRLRRSMDRLQEANKVASVMRRRESPRPLQASRLINAGVQEARAFTEPKLAPPPAAVIPQLAPAEPPRMAPSGGVVAIPLISRGKARRSLCPAPIPVRTSAPVTMPMRVVLTEPEPRCAPPIRGIESRAAAAQTRRRPMVAAWHCSTRPVLGGLVNRVHPPHVSPMAQAARPAAIGITAGAAKGRALRVSLAAGFRIPEWKLRPVVLRGPSSAAMVWPELRLLRSEPFNHMSKAAPEGLSPAEMMNAPEMRIPASPSPVFGTVFHWPEALKLSQNFSNLAAPHRSAVVPFTTNDEYFAKERSYEYRN
jgi:hypothetical protein